MAHPDALASTGLQPLTELRESTLESWLDKLSPEARGADHKILVVGTPAGELIARRIVATPEAHLYGKFEVEFDFNIGAHWKAVAR